MKLAAVRLAVRVALLGLALLLTLPSQAQQIYTCIDAQGRKLTADRPIAECRDREQNLLNPSGSLKGKVGPSLSELESKKQDEEAQKQALQLAQQAQENRRERALLMRYPSKTEHDQARVQSLAQIEVVMGAAIQRVEELTRQRAELEAEMEFYKKEPALAPPVLRRQLEENSQSLKVQQRFIDVQQSEMQRMNARFDDELSRLRPMWVVPIAPAESGAGQRR
ncbi:MAG: DUF4124 domain-containing protein [Burkholderiaceae bacterium]